MASILIISTQLRQTERWKKTLSKVHDVYCFENIETAFNFIQNCPVSVIVLDSWFFDFDTPNLLVSNSNGAKILITGFNWPEDRQLDALVAGYAGYCESDAADVQVLKAVSNILMGDIWIQRHLVPKVIETLVALNNSRLSKSNKTKSEFKIKVQALTHRELDVAKMISAGESNKSIASLLNISERTVKAHLTSIFQKLNVQDRLQLAVLFKENY